LRKPILICTGSAFFDEFVPPDYVKALLCRTCQGEKPKEGEPVCRECNGTFTIAKNIQPYTAQNLRELWAQSEDAKVVVSPDSMMVHIAGTMGIPCIGLWGPVNPANRVKYYKNHFPIYRREACQHSPCFAYTASFPKYCPPRGSERKVCEVMAAVNPQEVIDAVGKIRKQ
jgi:ADP-heptose:LPS heptosyltransferase